MKPYLTTAATIMLLSLSASEALSIPGEPLACNETDALLQVKYNITKEEWDSSRLPRSSFMRPPAFLLLHGSEIRYENFASLTDYEACIPRDECSEVVVGGLPTDAYELSFDGKAVDIGHEFLYDGTNPITSTEVGTCTKPVCKDNEALLQIQHWPGEFSHNLYDFRVEDKDGGTILSGDTESGERYSLQETYSCLPKDEACYTFLIGGENQLSLRTFATASYSVIFDGELVRRSDSWLFDSVRFGSKCEPLCNQDDESLVEFFMYDRWSDLPGVGYEYEWDLNITNPSSSETVSSGVVPMGPGVSPLAHNIMCVPKNSCSSFHITAPNVTREVVRPVPAEPISNTTDWDDIVWVNETRHEEFPLRPVYSLTMDNVNYRKVLWRTPGFESLGFDQTTNMGSCTVEGLCDVQTQDLFDLELRTAAKHEWPSISTEMRWNFGYTEFENNDWRLQNLLQDSHYNDRAFDLDSSYGVIECVPKDGCDLSFNITVESPADSHSVKKNGIQLDHSRVEGRWSWWEVLMTPFGQNCFPASNNSMSGIAIAGIVVVCIFAVSAVVLCLLLWCMRRQTKSSSEEAAEDPLHESLLGV